MTVLEKRKALDNYCEDYSCDDCVLSAPTCRCGCGTHFLSKRDGEFDMCDNEIEDAYKIAFGSVPSIKDSGERRSFNTGAVRDMAAGKGDMVSLPNAAILRLSKHYEAGATKYGRWNYLKGLPVSSFMDSALRHLFKYLDGWDDEDHLAAAAFNVLGAMEMEAKHKELIDIPNREGKECFDYEGK